MFRALGKQLRRPSGFFGTLVSEMLEIKNSTEYKKIIKELDIRNGEKIYEIGYGPGVGINLIASKFICTISGIDFSELMFKKATKRNKEFIEKGIVNLRYGDFLIFETQNEKYNKIFCVNVIYFWPDLNEAFKRVNSLLEADGEYLIYMEHRNDLEKFRGAQDFCKYSIENVENELINAGFTNVVYKLDKGYYIKSKKSQL
jgi:SAM-dependent methyltransferase